MSDDGTSEASRHRTDPSGVGNPRNHYSRSKQRKRANRKIQILALFISLSLIFVALYMASLTLQIRDHLTTTASLLSQIRLEVAGGNASEARNLVDRVQGQTRAAREVAENPLWNISSQIPFLGQNFAAVGEVARVADLVVTEAGNPLLDTADAVGSGALSPKDSGIDLTELDRISQSVATASSITEQARSRLAALDTKYVIPEISGPLNDVRRLLGEIQGPLDTGSQLAQLAPRMLGADEPRNYLVLIQNNAELRATGGLSGALAVLRVDHGHIELSAQATATGLGKFVPPIPVDLEQERIFSAKLGSQISGVNLTPDFPTAALTSKSMWEKRYGTTIDGVVALDPVVLSHLLEASGPLPLDPGINALYQHKMPTKLTAENVTKLLLSDVYSSLGYEEQDQFFAAAARGVFEALTSGRSSGLQLFRALVDSSTENRLHVWSGRDSEQKILSSMRIGGSMSSGPDAGPGSFGVFFNDGTGSKMDYYTRHSVRLAEQCSEPGHEQTTVRVSITSDAPADAATSLPVGVTGGGSYGVPPGLVQTNIVIYGPPGASVESAEVNGKKTDFAPYLHSSRPVGVITTRLAPGETRVVELKFGNTGDPADSHLLVTPTVQDVQDVVLPPDASACEGH